MRPTLTPLIAAAALSLGLSACHDMPEYQSDMLGNFDALWTACLLYTSDAADD